MSCVGKRDETHTKVLQARQKDMETETYRDRQRGVREVVRGRMID